MFEIFVYPCIKLPVPCLSFRLCVTIRKQLNRFLCNVMVGRAENFCPTQISVKTEKNEHLSMGLRPSQV
jgi:hypothetical protein